MIDIKKKDGNFILIDCSDMNSKATIELSSKVLDVIKGRYDTLVNIKVRADNN